ncbi:MAG: mannose-1-phosphate guanylyltransferase [Planctomycetota bacterium]
MTDSAHLWAVIMAGGSGTRFWPLSRGSHPKQLSRIVGDATMIQATVARLQPLIPAERTLVITTAAVADETRRQLPMLPPANVIAEPVGRDTAPCVCLAAEILHQLDPQATMVLLPADQVISPADRFQEHLLAGAAAAEGGALVTYGIAPRFAATGYGYVQLGSALGGDDIATYAVERFVEKPDADTAAAYVADGGYRWNSGIFTWRVDTVRAGLAEHCPALSSALAPVGAAFGGDAFNAALEAAYPGLDKISIDYALMEHAQSIVAVSCDFDWDDVGSWDALYDHEAADADGLRIRGQVVALGCRDSLLVEAGGPTLTAIGVEGITVVSTADAVLILPKGDSQRVKDLYARLASDYPDLI